jgi:hypothetical protein
LSPPLLYRLIRGAALINIIGVDGGGGWGRRLHRRRWHDFVIGGILLMHLLFFLIGVTEDQDLAIAERLEEFAVEVTKKLFGELHIPCDVRDEVLLIQRRRKIHHRDLLRGSTLLKDQRVGAA